MNRQHNCQIINFLQQPTQAKLFAPIFCSPTPFFWRSRKLYFDNSISPSPIVNFTTVLNGTRVVGDSLSLPNDQNKILNMKKQHTFRGSRTTYINSFTPHPRRGSYLLAQETFASFRVRQRWSFRDHRWFFFELIVIPILRF